MFLCMQWNYLHPYNIILLFHLILVLRNHTKSHTVIFYPQSKYVFMEYLWNIPMKYFLYVRKKFSMKFRKIFRNNNLGLLNTGIFPACSMNILGMLHAFFRKIKKRNSSFLYCIRLFLIWAECLWKSNISWKSSDQCQ